VSSVASVLFTFALKINRIQNYFQRLYFHVDTGGLEDRHEQTNENMLLQRRAEVYKLDAASHLPLVPVAKTKWM